MSFLLCLVGKKKVDSEARAHAHLHPIVGGGTWQSQRPLDAPPRTIPVFLTGGETPPLRAKRGFTLPR